MKSRSIKFKSTSSTFVSMKIISLRVSCSQHSHERLRDILFFPRSAVPCRRPPRFSAGTAE